MKSVGALEEADYLGETGDIVHFESLICLLGTYLTTFSPYLAVILRISKFDTIPCGSQGSPKVPDSDSFRFAGYQHLWVFFAKDHVPDFEVCTGVDFAIFTFSSVMKLDFYGVIYI